MKYIKIVGLFFISSLWLSQECFAATSPSWRQESSATGTKQDSLSSFSKELEYALPEVNQQYEFSSDDVRNELVEEAKKRWQDKEKNYVY